MAQHAVPVVWSPDDPAHDPQHEVWVGVADDRHRGRRRGSTRSSSALRGRRSPAGRGRRRTPTSVLARGPRRRSCSTFLRTRRRRAGRPGPYDELVGQDRVVPYLFPTAGDDRRAARPARGRGARRGRPVRLRHDDAGRARHLGGGPRGRRLRARPRPTWSPAGEPLGVRALPAAGPPRDARRATAAPATSTTPRSRPRRCATPATSGSAIVDVDAHHGNGTAGDLLRPRRRALRLGARRPGGRLVPARRRATPTRPAPAPGAGATRNLPLARGHRRRPLARRRRATSPTGWPPRAARRWSSRSASTPPPTTRRARCWSPPTATARPGGCSAATGLPAVVVQEGGYHLPTLGGLVAAYLGGHADPR